MIRYIDLDGTLAHYIKWEGPEVIGAPVQAMVDKVKKWIQNGNEIVIFTTRLADTNYVKVEERPLAVKAIQKWCMQVFGQIFRITAQKGQFDYCYDDRGITIVRNTGLTLGETLLNYIADLRQETDLTNTHILRAVIEYLKNINKELVESNKSVIG